MISMAGRRLCLSLENCCFSPRTPRVRGRHSCWLLLHSYPTRTSGARHGNNYSLPFTFLWVDKVQLGSSDAGLTWGVSCNCCQWDLGLESICGLRGVGGQPGPSPPPQVASGPLPSPRPGWELAEREIRQAGCSVLAAAHGLCSGDQRRPPEYIEMII